MPRIRFYISSHGFGHSTREIAVISEIPEWIDVDIVTSAPQWLFQRSIKRRFHYQERRHDPGVVQFDCLHQDVESTYRTWRDLLDQYPAMVAEEASRFDEREPSLIVGDISPFATATAMAVHRPCVIIANFSWDWIFSALVKYNAKFQTIIDRIAAYYRETTLLLRTPLSGDLSVFPHIEDIPIIARRSNRSRLEARRGFGIEEHERVVLISFGGHEFEHIPVDRLAAHAEITFLTFNRRFAGPANVRFLDPYASYHPDAVRASDLVLTKMGYGIVTECIAHQTPMAYPPREDFPEHDVLVRESRQYIPVLELASEDFFSGRWLFLDTLFDRGEKIRAFSYPIANVHGAQKAAERLISILNETVA
ncbi:MAG: hypothetical protein C4527_23170 [Candidatus Omnitrophota bacterium]|jgi:L-arabinokinase|nr:MAG: hypothetical protein C4527_23170 [Candidatus Omnitrophota bacterium]